MQTEKNAAVTRDYPTPEVIKNHEIMQDESFDDDYEPEGDGEDTMTTAWSDEDDNAGELLAHKRQDLAEKERQFQLALHCSRQEANARQMTLFAEEMPGASGSGTRGGNAKQHGSTIRSPNVFIPFEDIPEELSLAMAKEYPDFGKIVDECKAFEAWFPLTGISVIYNLDQVLNPHLPTSPTQFPTLRMYLDSPMPPGYCYILAQNH
ncbi:hypothetical protein BDV93DRAFT_561315 [Ceratobasidium sp. AG-I]|nr:hypothetical protein BDV93DRAFT_561315 [Ceratobasidium sp. AG-I]